MTDSSTEIRSLPRLTRRSVLKGSFGTFVIGSSASNTALGHTQTLEENSGQAGTQSTSDWPRPGFDDQNTRHSPNTMGPESDIGVAYGVGFDVDEVYRECAAVVSDGTVYMTAGGQDNKLYAFDAEDGTREWTYEADVLVEAPPVVAGGVTYLAAREYLYALNPTDGSEIWRKETPAMGDMLSAPAVVSGTLYHSNNGGTYAMDPDTGDLLWHVREYWSDRPVAVQGGTVYIAGRYDGPDRNDTRRGVFALSASDGSLQWSTELEGKAGNAPPVIQGSKLFVGGSHNDETGDGGNLYALDPQTGNELWRYVPTAPSYSDRESGAGYVSAPATTDSLAVVYLFGIGIAAVDVTDGSEVWLNENGSGSWNTGLPTPAIANGTVYTQGEFGLLALDLKTGEQLWELPKLEMNIARTAVDNGRVYVGTTSDGVYSTDDSDVVIESTTILPARLYALESGGQSIPGLTIDAPSEPSTGTEVTFTARLSDGFEPSNWTFTWGIVDGKNVQRYQGKEISHRYSNSGEFDVGVGISDPNGAGTASQTEVTVRNDGGVTAVETQSGENEATNTESNDSGIAIFERLGDKPAVPLTIGGAAIGGAGLAAYRWLNDTDSMEDNDSDE